MIFRPTFCSRSFKPTNAGCFRNIFHRLYEELPWQPVNKINTCWLTAGKCNCSYKHSGRPFPAVPFTPMIAALGAQIANTIGHPQGFSSCNANLYYNGNNSLGMHSDNETMFGELSQPKLIVSFSLGAARDFNIFVKKENLNFTIKILNGEIVTMEGLFQQECTHGVPADPTVVEPRINLTFRNVVNHRQGCPCLNSS